MNISGEKKNSTVCENEEPCLQMATESILVNYNLMQNNENPVLIASVAFCQKCKSHGLEDFFQEISEYRVSVHGTVTCKSSHKMW